jgi:hypothetical protein
MNIFEQIFSVNFCFGLDNNQAYFNFTEDVAITDVNQNGNYGAEEAMRQIKKKFRGCLVTSINLTK